MTVAMLNAMLCWPKLFSCGACFTEANEILLKRTLLSWLSIYIPIGSQHRAHPKIVTDNPKPDIQLIRKTSIFEQ